MLFDLEKQSSFYQPFDELKLFSQDVSEGKMEDGQVVNLIVSDSLKQEVYQNIGDTFSYCISTPTSKRNGNLVYRPNSCQLKYKVRAIASMMKMPGFPKFSSYKQINLLGPGVIATQN